MHVWLVFMKAFQALFPTRPESIERTKLGDSDFRVLEALLHKGPLPVNTIGPKVWLTPGSISVAVDRLVKKGLVARKEHPHDRRVRQVELTAKGRALISSRLSRTRRSDGKSGCGPFKKGAADIAAAVEKIGQTRGRNSQVNEPKLRRPTPVILDFRFGQKMTAAFDRVRILNSAGQGEVSVILPLVNCSRIPANEQIS